MMSRKYLSTDVAFMGDPSGATSTCRFFGRRPYEKVGQHKNLLVTNAREAKCSLRMFMLSVMIGHLADRKLQIEHNADHVQREKFHPIQFTRVSAIKTANMYRKICQRE